MFCNRSMVSHRDREEEDRLLDDDDREPLELLPLRLLPLPLAERLRRPLASGLGLRDLLREPCRPFGSGLELRDRLRELGLRDRRRLLASSEGLGLRDRDRLGLFERDRERLFKAGDPRDFFGTGGELERRLAVCTSFGGDRLRLLLFLPSLLGLRERRLLYEDERLDAEELPLLLLRLLLYERPRRPRDRRRRPRSLGDEERERLLLLLLRPEDEE